MLMMSFMMRCLKWNRFSPEMFRKAKRFNGLHLPRQVFGANFFLLVLALVLFLLGSCKKEKNLVGLDVLPPEDLLNPAFNDTSSLLTYTVREDSLFSDETSLNLIGSYNDPAFGKTTASAYTQLVLPDNVTNVSFGSDPALDSLVLILPYSANYYGDKTDPQTFKVYEITQAMYKDSSYHSKRTLTTASVPIGNVTFIPKPTDSLSIASKNYAPHLRIKLDSAFGAAIIAQSPFIDNAAFLSFLKGLYIVPDNPSQTSGEGAILHFDLTNPISGMTLYYRKNKTTPLAGDTANITFQINNSAARFSHFNHDYSFASPALTSQINGTDLNQGKDLVYVQATVGVKTKLFFPHIKDWTKDGAVAVNMAELVLKVAGDTAGYPPPSKLALVRLDELNKIYYLVDEDQNQNGQADASSNIGGSYNSTNKEYRLNISQHIQQLMNGELNDYGLYLVVPGAVVSANRVILGGSDNTAYKIKLRLSTTKIN